MLVVFVPRSVIAAKAALMLSLIEGTRKAEREAHEAPRPALVRLPPPVASLHWTRAMLRREAATVREAEAAAREAEASAVTPHAAIDTF